MRNPQEMVEQAVALAYPYMPASEVQTLAPGVYTALLYETDSITGTLRLGALAHYEIRAVQVGEPVLFPVAGSEA